MTLWCREGDQWFGARVVRSHDGSECYLSQKREQRENGRGDHVRVLAVHYEIAMHGRLIFFTSRYDL